MHKKKYLLAGFHMRKLVLYSDQIFPDTKKVDDELLDLLGKSNPTIGYIPSSSDSPRKSIYFEECRSYYNRLGMDLLLYFGLDTDYNPGKLEELLTCDAIHLSGGNTYYFLHWLRNRNMLIPLRRYVEKGGVLIGVSAGAILMTPDISTSTLCGDEPLEGETDFSALNLVDFAFVPHFGETASDLGAIQAYSQAHRIAVYVCRDGEGIIVEEDHVKCIGDVTIIRNG
jgi:dipeptidase E